MLKSTSSNNVSVYQVSGTNFSRALPDWVAKKRKKSLKNDLEYQHRIELIQDFEFSEASNKIKVTNDGKYCMATGVYKPQIHVYDFANLSLKFDRHTNAENVNFVLLSDDWTKSVHLQNDRSIEFQNKGGIHYRTRIPTFGRDLAYEPESCNLFVAASSNELYRLNLAKGVFLQPFELQNSSKNQGANCLDINQRSSLVSVGLEDNVVEFWDPRARTCVARLAIPTDISSESGLQGITATAFKNDGLHFACGTCDGRSLIYDLRSSEPISTKDQGYGYEIKKLKWLNTNSANSDAADLILSSDKRIVKIWNANSGKPFASMEPSVDINDVEHIPGSGMFFMANEGIQMHSYFIPQLGPAPEWCSFLENLTEEMEEKPSDTIYSNYKFIDKAELQKLNISHLVGTKVLRSYMHGYFIHNELYDKVSLIAKSISYQDIKEREIKKRLDAASESRVKSKSKSVKINRSLLDKLSEKKDGDKMVESVLHDDRFKEAFENPEFEIDEESHDYKQLNPVKSTGKALTAAEEENEERLESSDSDSDSKDSESEKEDSTESESEQDSDHEVAEKMRIAEEKAAQREKARIEKYRKAKEESDKFLQSIAHSTAPELVVSESQPQQKSLKSLSKDVDRKHRITKEQNSSEQLRLQRQGKGEMEISFVPQTKHDKKKIQKKIEDEDYDEEKHGRKKQRFEGRRLVSKKTMFQ